MTGIRSGVPGRVMDERIRLHAAFRQERDPFTYSMSIGFAAGAL